MRRVRRLLGLLGLGAVAALAFALWPQSLGGRVAYTAVAGSSMDSTLHAGDLVIVQRQHRYRIGDIVAYRPPARNIARDRAVIHRLVGGDGSAGFIARGDHNHWNDPWQPTTHDIIGRRWLVVPRGGRVVSFMRAPLPLATLAAAIVFSIVRGPTRRSAPSPAHRYTPAP